MAKLNLHKMHEHLIDGQSTLLPPETKIMDVVSSDVTAVEAFDPQRGKTVFFTREQFNQNLPPGITTHLTPIEKG